MFVSYLLLLLNIYKKKQQTRKPSFNWTDTITITRAICQLLESPEFRPGDAERVHTSASVSFGALIGSGVSWFRYQSFEAVWHGFREASIHVTRAKTGDLQASGSRLPGCNPPWRGPGLLLGARGSPFSGNADRAQGILGNAGCVWATVLHPGPP